MMRPPVPISMPAVTAAMRAARVTRWLRREGEFVQAGDPVLEISFERCDMEVEAPRSGTLTCILVPAGAGDVMVGATLGLIETAPAPHRAPGSEARVSPRARRLARDHGLALDGLEGSGPGKRIVERDIFAALAPNVAFQPLERLANSAGSQLTLVTAWAPVPQAVLECDCDIDALEVFRTALSTPDDPRVSLTDCALRALALALQEAPDARWASGDLAWARLSEGRVVAAPLPGASTLSLARIAAARKRYEAVLGAAQGRVLLVNAGPLGVKRLFPALVAPWWLMLALGAAEARPIVRASALAQARIVSVTLSLDRRFVETVEAARVLMRFRTLMENPALLALENLAG